MSPSNYPAAVGYIVNVIMAAVVSFNFLTPSTAHAIAVAVVALTSLIVAFMVRPFLVAAATGAFQTFITAVAAFGFHLTDQQIAGVVAIFGLIAAIITHQLVIPAAAAKRSITGNQAEGLPVR